MTYRLLTYRLVTDQAVGDRLGRRTVFASGQMFDGAMTMQRGKLVYDEQHATAQAQASR